MKARKLSLIKNLVKSVVILALLIIPVSSVFSWGVLPPSTTHQFILQEAYNLLKADPAFNAAKFPSLEEIMNHEGVSWVNVNFTGEGTTGMDASMIEGPGPDSKGNSPFSWHYYNPDIVVDGVRGQGNGPDAVKKFYLYLAEGMLKGHKEVLPKSAAWSAHFLADMHCPYHVNGINRETAKKILQEQEKLHEDEVYFDDKLKGSVKLAYSAPVKYWSNNFNTEIKRFMKTDYDWFDPWYYNGNTEKMMSNMSSHIVWEGLVRPGTYNLKGYVPGWENGKVSLDNPVDEPAGQMAKLAVNAAQLTRSRLEYFFNNPKPMINQAIRSVYTMWRSSLSAMEIKLESKNDKDGLVVKGKVTNRGKAAFTKVEARLTPVNCEIIDNKNTQVLGTLPAGGIVTTNEWKIKTTDKPCELKLEAAGSTTMPDLQYAFAKNDIKVESLKIEPQKVTMNKKDKMTFKAILNSKETKEVTWSIKQGAAGGTITPEGSYLPPQQGGTFQVIATSKTNQKLNAQAEVNIVGIFLETTITLSVPNNPIPFKVLGSNIPEKSKYEWDFGDGSAPVTIDTAAVTHSYANKGIYKIAVKLIDSISNKVLDEATGSVNIDNDKPAQAKPVSSAFMPVFNNSFALPAIPEDCAVVWNQGQKANDAVYESERKNNPEKYPDYYLFELRLKCSKTKILEKGTLEIPYHSKPLAYKIDYYYSGDGSPWVGITLKYMPNHKQADLIKLAEETANSWKQYKDKYKSTDKIESFTFPGWNAGGTIKENKRGGFNFIGLGENKTFITIWHGGPMVQFGPEAGGFFPHEQCLSNGKYCNKEESKTADDFELSEKNKRINKYQDQLKKRAVDFLSGTKLKGLNGFQQ